MLGATMLTVAPWQIYCMLAFPDEYWHEHSQVWRHLYTNVEQWAAPWDRLLFDYAIAIHGVFYTPVLTAMIVLFGKAIGQRHAGVWLLYAWSLGVVVPHLFAVTKTPSATVLALPASLLFFGFLISSATRGERWSVVALAAILFMCVVMPPVVNRPGHGFPQLSGFGGVMRQTLWVVYHLAAVLGALAFFGVILLLVRTIARLDGATFGIWLGRAALVPCAGVMIWLSWQTVAAAWRVTDADLNDPGSVEVGRFVRAQLPEHSVLICEQRKGYESSVLMFYTGRTCYPLSARGHELMAQRIQENGGEPYLVTPRRLPLEVVHACRESGPIIYRLRP
jgi:hypothetical protein